MSKISKILIFISLTLVLGAGVFAISHFSEAEGGIAANDFSDSVYVCPNAPSLEEINPLCQGIIILNFGEEEQGMLLTQTAYDNKEYYLVQGFRNGGAGHFGTAEKSIKGIYDKIQELTDSAFRNNPEQRKNALTNKLKEVFLNIENKKYEDAANKLRNDIRSKMDGSLGGNPKDDWIIDPIAQKDLAEMIEGLILHITYGLL